MARKGYWAGYGLYRYGSQKKPTLATLPRVLKGQRREDAISKAVEILRDWRSSPFQHEGAVRAGLRSALCIEGHRWAIADNEAAKVLEEGFRLMGAERPTEEEGQPGYTIPEENCQWCGREIDLEERTETGRYRFCSAVCAQSAMRKREFDDGWWNSRVGFAAYNVVRRERNPTRKCKQCGDEFHPLLMTDGKYIFCSPKCRNEAMRVIPDRACKHCGNMFRPRASTDIFCGRGCYHAYRVAQTYSLTCSFCGEAFESTAKTTRFCSNSHRLRAQEVLRGIELMETTGKPYRPRTPHALRMLDAYLIERNAASGKIDTAAPHPVHRLFDQSPAIQAPRILTAAVFDGFFLMAA